MIYLVRHAESIGNAKGSEPYVSTVPLTERGFIQAKELADKISRRPDLIVISPFVRTYQTSLPLRQKFANTQVEIWNVEEFTILSDETVNKLSKEESKVLLDDFFARNDPDFYYSGGESFNNMLGRVDSFLKKAKKISKEKFVVVFTHGGFIRAVQFRMQNIPFSVDAFFAIPAVENAGIIEI